MSSQTCMLKNLSPTCHLVGEGTSTKAPTETTTEQIITCLHLQCYDIPLNFLLRSFSPSNKFYGGGRGCILSVRHHAMGEDDSAALRFLRADASQDPRRAFKGENWEAERGGWSSKPEHRLNTFISDQQSVQPLVESNTGSLGFVRCFPAAVDFYSAIIWNCGKSTFGQAENWQ